MAAAASESKLPSWLRIADSKMSFSAWADDGALVMAGADVWLKLEHFHSVQAATRALYSRLPTRPVRVYLPLVVFVMVICDHDLKSDDAFAYCSISSEMDRLLLLCDDGNCHTTVVSVVSKGLGGSGVAGLSEHMDIRKTVLLPMSLGIEEQYQPACTKLQLSAHPPAAP